MFETPVSRVTFMNQPQHIQVSRSRNWNETLRGIYIYSYNIVRFHPPKKIEIIIIPTVTWVRVINHAWSALQDVRRSLHQ